MSDHLRGYGWRHATWCRWEKAQGTCDCGLRKHQDAASPPAADPLDVERLAEALHAVGVGCSSYICEPTTSTYIGLRKTMHETDAREAAAEYARLAAEGAGS